MPTRREFLQVAGMGTAASVLRLGPVRRPNLLVVLADDMGYSDARCYGGDVDTLNLDRLAAGGLRFTQAYSTARCKPSRSFPLQAPMEDIEKYRDRFGEGWVVARERKSERMRRMGLINCALAPLEPGAATRSHATDAECIREYSHQFRSD